MVLTPWRMVKCADQWATRAFSQASLIESLFYIKLRWAPFHAPYPKWLWLYQKRCAPTNRPHQTAADEKSMRGHREKLRRELSEETTRANTSSLGTEKINYCCFSAQSAVICYGSYGEVMQRAQFQSSCLAMLRQPKDPITEHCKRRTRHHQSSGTRQKPPSCLSMLFY